MNVILKRSVASFAAVIMVAAMAAAWTTDVYAGTAGAQSGQQPAASAAEDQTADGWQEKDGVYYYRENGKPVTGWKTIDGRRYHFGESGEMSIGLCTIDGRTYWFDESGSAGSGLGEMKKGLVELNGSTYWFEKNGRAAGKGWIKCYDGKRRYGLGGGRIATGKTKIGKTWYYFTAEGLKHGKGFFSDESGHYCCIGGGKLATGWIARGDHAYYFYRGSAKRAYSRTVGHLRIGRSGRLGKAYAMGVRCLGRNGWSLRSAYRYSRGIVYARKGMRLGSIDAYAVYGFKKHSGNCYVHASTFYVQAKLLGYDAHQVKGEVVGQPHSWVTIRQHGKLYVYDLTFPGDGWKFQYGKKGTWRYSNYSNMD